MSITWTQLTRILLWTSSSISPSFMPTILVRWFTLNFSSWFWAWRSWWLEFSCLNSCRVFARLWAKALLLARNVCFCTDIFKTAQKENGLLCIIHVTYCYLLWFLNTIMKLQNVTDPHFVTKNEANDRIFFR